LPKLLGPPEDVEMCQDDLRRATGEVRETNKRRVLDFDDLDDIFNFDDKEPREEPSAPDFRLTIRGRRLSVEPWAPYLLTGGPNGKLVRDRAGAGVTIADLWVTGEDSRELVVTYLAVADRQRADRKLIRWAESVGHRRLWLPDRLVQLDTARPLGVARVDCPTCGARWEDSSPDFWHSVRTSGRFPTICVICHGDLPQWGWRPGPARHRDQLNSRQ
jgi:hypothetical protein